MTAAVPAAIITQSVVSNRRESPIARAPLARSAMIAKIPIFNPVARCKLPAPTLPSPKVRKSMLYFIFPISHEMGIEPIRNDKVIARNAVMVGA